MNLQRHNWENTFFFFLLLHTSQFYVQSSRERWQTGAQGIMGGPYFAQGSPNDWATTTTLRSELGLG